MAQPDVETDPEEALELRKEAFTMALYVAICLLAALSLVSEHGDKNQVDTFKIVWGTTLGLALAHWFAFRVSSPGRVGAGPPPGRGRRRGTACRSRGGGPAGHGPGAAAPPTRPS